MEIEIQRKLGRHLNFQNFYITIVWKIRSWEGLRRPYQEFSHSFLNREFKQTKQYSGFYICRNHTERMSSSHTKLTSLSIEMDFFKGISAL